MDHASRKASQADAEVLSVLAQAGEGSVRDSLSALDQAIACCGTKLKAAEVRELLGMFSLDSLGAGDRGARPTGDSQENVRRGGGARSATAAACNISPRAGALFPQSAGGQDRRQRRPGWWRIARRAAGTPGSRPRSSSAEEDLTRYLAAHAGSVPRSAELAAAAAASGNRTAAAGPCRPLAADRRSAGGAGMAARGRSLPRPEASLRRQARRTASRRHRLRQQPPRSRDRGRSSDAPASRRCSKPN